MFWKATSKQLETVPCKDMCRSVHVAIKDEVEMDWVEKEGGERRRRILARDIRNNWGKYILIIILNKDGRSPRRWTQNALSNGNVGGGPPTNNLGAVLFCGWYSVFECSFRLLHCQSSNI